MTPSFFAMSSANVSLSEFVGRGYTPQPRMPPDGDPYRGRGGARPTLYRTPLRARMKPGRNASVAVYLTPIGCDGSRLVPSLYPGSGNEIRTSANPPG